ncbi:hypothetical protein ACJMK2_000257, partial [Sinanodonta woodiana]
GKIISFYTHRNESIPRDSNVREIRVASYIEFILHRSLSVIEMEGFLQIPHRQK